MLNYIKDDKKKSKSQKLFTINWYPNFFSFLHIIDDMMCICILQPIIIQAFIQNLPFKESGQRKGENFSHNLFVATPPLDSRVFPACRLEM